MAAVGFLHALKRRVATGGLLPTRGGGGAPYPGANYKPAMKALDFKEFDTVWQDGTMNPEPVLDQWATQHISTGGALAYFMGGCGLFFTIWKGVEYSDCPNRNPVADREFPYNNLQRELGN